MEASAPRPLIHLCFLSLPLLCLLYRCCPAAVFQNMSANVQGAIVIVGVFSLFDVKEFFYCWRVNKLDALCWMAT